MINLIQVLYKLERAGYIKVIRTAGLDVIRLEKDIDYITAIKEYYNLLNNQSGEKNGREKDKDSERFSDLN